MSTIAMTTNFFDSLLRQVSSFGLNPGEWLLLKPRFVKQQEFLLANKVDCEFQLLANFEVVEQRNRIEARIRQIRVLSL